MAEQFDPPIQYVEDGQLKQMALSKAVLTLFSGGRQLDAMPASFDIALRSGAANGLKEAVFVTADVFFASVIEMVNEARADLVANAKATDQALQDQLNTINGMPVLKPINPALAVPYTAGVAILAATTKTVVVALPGVVKDEPIIANPTSMPAGWGFSGVKASAKDQLTFTLTLPPIAINGTGTCTFSVFAQRKLVM
ncbi:hypothetical protein [Methylorubrum sp. SB2]|uniref:hypothetical protein n=1 Tax=Methylorubrum subtropicum TaxID=3138812 RepID=UPI00313D4A5F